MANGKSLTKSFKGHVSDRHGSSTLADGLGDFCYGDSLDSASSFPAGLTRRSRVQSPRTSTLDRLMIMIHSHGDSFMDGQQRFADQFAPRGNLLAECFAFKDLILFRRLP